MRFLFGTLRSLLMVLIVVGAVAAIAYFAIIKPAEDKVNDATKAPGVGVEQARQLAECVAASGGNLDAIKKCQKKFPIAP
jgi:hypothetical protein